MKRKLGIYTLPLVMMGILIILSGSVKKDGFLNMPKTTNETVTDVDGNVYNTITIGSQVWLVENLKVTHYRNGDPISIVTDSSSWSSLTSGAYCNYQNNESNSTTYGRLYNYNAVIDNRNIAPVGYHVPSKEEWATLISTLGGESEAINKMKEVGTSHWSSPNTGVDNSSGFTALPGGGRNYNASFDLLGSYASWWSVTNDDVANAWFLYLYSGRTDAHLTNGDKLSGMSVRCIKD
jgi:uncharacterized protein (TIGR02145 family)